MDKEYFPLWQATGESFCNRVAERKALKTDLLAGRHSWLMAPRRYGKSSLVAQVLHDLENVKKPKVHSQSIDLLPAYDNDSIQEIVLNGAGQLIGQISPAPKRALQAALQYLATFKPEVSIDVSGAKVKLTPSDNPVTGIREALLGLDQLASHHKLRAVFVMDEFQAISSIKDAHSLEASIRHAVERAKSVTYVFSGSNRHLLTHMFEDSSRPLYHLCHQVTLERIAESDYKKHLDKMAKKKWKKALPENVFSLITQYTERHPYYLNKLCSMLWRLEKMPTERMAEKTWDVCIKQEKPAIVGEIGELSPNQRAVLKALAENPVDQPRSKVFLTRSKMAGTSVSQTLDVLLQKDLIYRDQANYYQVLNPIIKEYFS